jgi:rubrerythrin
MQDSTLQDLVQAIDIMSEVEKTVGEFYKECAGFFRFDSEFWLDLSRDEALHSGALAKLSQMIKRKPSEYEPGKLSPASALKTFISRIHSEQERLKNGTLTMYSALMAAYHMETTMIECSYTQVVKTTNPKCITALENLSAASVKHRGKTKKKMERYKKDPGAPRLR